ncbi:MAG: SusD/RagB family nutrient-binding outer membrane lipoprotein [Bacteroidales bacterium]|nr:SusD/RagB family nutrient-binding outer membrane lipoprotein [Bacteroidales bacterium]
MKKILFILLVFVIASCSKDFEEMNTNTKSPETVAGETLFTNAQKELSDQLASVNVNTNIWKLWARYITETTYVDEANYDIINRSQPDNAFRTFYRDILRDLMESSDVMGKIEFVAAEDIAAQKNRLAIVEVLNVFAYQRLVDMFGNIPYSESLKVDETTTPIYDDAEGIYADLFSRLDAAISNLDAANGSFGSADVYYGGDVAQWIKFANSLKLKMAITVADVAGLNPGTKAAAAAAAGVIDAEADNCTMVYLGASPNTNPLFLDLVASGRHDFVATADIIDTMLYLVDPRIDMYYDPIDTSSDGSGKYAHIGGAYGYSNPYDVNSHLSATLEVPSFECMILSYEEVEFYLAEAVERGWAVGGTAEDHYNNGIMASIAYWSNGSDDGSAYVALPAVAYSTAAGTNWQEKIGFQSWLAAFNRGFIGYTTMRRLDFHTFPQPPQAKTDDGSLPLRFTYPVDEQTLNGANHEAASAAIGGDNMLTKLFWDAN